MSEMTMREAVQILSAVSQQSKAVKMLEGALSAVVAMEGQIKISEDKKGLLEDKVANLSNRLIELGSQVEAEETSLASKLKKSADLVADAQAQARAENVKTEEVMNSNKILLGNQIEEMEKSLKEKTLEVNHEVALKKEDLKSITNKIEKAENELASIKKRLG